MSLSPPPKRIPDDDLRGLEAMYSPRDRPPPVFRSILALGDRYLLITRPNGIQGIVCCVCWRLSWAQSHVQQRVCPHCPQHQEGHANA